MFVKVFCEIPLISKVDFFGPKIYLWVPSKKGCVIYIHKYPRFVYLYFCTGKGREATSPSQSFQVGRFWEGPTHNKFSLHAVPRPTSVFGGLEHSPVYLCICLSKPSRMIYEFPREARSVKIFPGMGREGSGKIPRTKMFVGLILHVNRDSSIFIKIAC